MTYSEDDDFFGGSGPDRDRWGRPLLVPNGSPSAMRAPYTRASSLADYVVSKRGLHQWQLRYLAKGMGEREDLAGMAAALPPLTGDNKVDRPTFLELDPIIEKALDHAGVHTKAHYGTAMHAFTDEHRPSGPPPARMQSDLEAIEAVLKLARARVVATELFVACDEVMSAGTFDKEVEYDYLPLLRVMDLKTGELRPHEWAIQLAVYAHGDLYDVATDTRVDRSTGVDLGLAEVLWAPRGSGQAFIFELDIEAGWEMAKTAKRVKEYQDRDDLMRYKFDVPKLDLALRITQAASPEAIRKLWSDHRSRWDDDLTALAKDSVEAFSRK